jgi:glycosyltransferase involved in cell wall biosynthesis
MKTIRPSLDSILNQIDDRFEVIVVDSHSNDGSFDILSKYERNNKIKLISKKCNRGIARQTAFEISTGKYILSHMDLDDIFKPVLKELLSIYHTKFEGYLLYANKPPKWGGITIGPKVLLNRIEGWSDLQYSEDWELWAKAAKINLFKILTFESREKIGLPDSAISDNWQRIKHRYFKYRDLYRLGRNVFIENEKINRSQKIIAFLAYVTYKLFSSHFDVFYQSFDPENYRENTEY